jgi:hypothetical protein
MPKRRSCRCWRGPKRRGGVARLCAMAGVGMSFGKNVAGWWKGEHGLCWWFPCFEAASGGDADGGGERGGGMVKSGVTNQLFLVRRLL